MTVEEIKLRRMTNQYLITPADKLTVVRDLCGIQAQFMVNAIHSLKIRCSDFDEATVKDDLVKNWTIRGTGHVFAQSDLPLFLHCNGGVDYRRNEWDDPSFWNQRKNWALTPERQRYLSQVILNGLDGRELTREELKQLCRNIEYIYLPTVMEGSVPKYTYRLEKGITADRHGMIIIRNEGILDILK